MAVNIDRSMRAQERAKRLKKRIDPSKIDRSVYKEYDINFAGRETQLFYNEKTGEVIVEGLIFKPKVKENDGFLSVIVAGHEYNINMTAGTIFLDGRIVDFSYIPAVPELERRSLAGKGAEIIRAPLPGVVVGIHVSEGDEITPGQKVITLEAMKMQNDLITEKGGIVKRILVKLQDQVNNDTELVRIEQKDGESSVSNK